MRRMADLNALLTGLGEDPGIRTRAPQGLQSESKGKKIPYSPLVPPDLCTDLCTTSWSRGAATGTVYKCTLFPVSRDDGRTN